MTRGRFITIEGIEGVGKSTNVAFVAELLAAMGLAVRRTREPGGTPLAEDIRNLVVAPRSESVAPATELLLMFAARAQHVHGLIAPALAQGEWVLCDRFTDATFAYQGAGRGFDDAVLAQLERWVQHTDGAPGLRQPDLTLWFDVAPAVAAARRAQAREADRLEREDLAFFGRVAAGYAARRDADPARFARIDAGATLAEVAQQVQVACRARAWW